MNQKMRQQNILLQCHSIIENPQKCVAHKHNVAISLSPSQELMKSYER